LKRILSSVLAFFGGAEAYNKSRFVLTGCKSAVNFFLLCFLFLYLRVKLKTKKVLEVHEKCFGVQEEAPSEECVPGQASIQNLKIQQAREE